MMIAIFSTLMGLAAFATDFPTASELRNMVASRQAVVRENSAWFVQSGKVYEMNLLSNDVKRMRDTSKVKSILSLGDFLVALRTNGEIYMYHSGENRWLELGNSATDLLSADGSLIAVTSEGELWLWQGTPGELTITFIPVVTRVGKTTIVNMIPMINGRNVSFLDTGVLGVSKISPTEDGDVLIEYSDGGRESFRELGISLEDKGVEFSIAENLKDGGFEIGYEDGDTHRVKKLIIEKSAERLYATVRYELDRFWFSGSPKYKLPLPQLYSWIESGGERLSVERFFEDVIVPLSGDSRPAWRIRGTRSSESLFFQTDCKKLLKR